MAKETDSAVLIQKYNVPGSSRREDPIYTELPAENWKHSGFINAWQAWLQERKSELDRMPNSLQKLDRIRSFATKLRAMQDQLQRSPEPPNPDNITCKRTIDRRKSVFVEVQSLIDELNRLYRQIEIEIEELPTELLGEIRDLSKKSTCTNWLLIGLTLVCALGAVAQIWSCTLQINKP